MGRGNFFKRSGLFLALVLGLGVGALFSIQCGSATIASNDDAAGAAGGGGSPTTVSIPAPIVTKIAISDPVDGLVTITGSAGSVTGGNIVEAVNLTQTGQSRLLEHLLWGVAYAATTNQTTAAADGSFSLQLTANLGDRIRVTQLDAAGNASDAVTLTAPYEPIALDYTPLDIAIDPDSATAYVLGVKNSQGVITPLNLGSSVSLGTEITLPNNCPSPTALEIYGAQDRLYVIDNTNSTVCRQPQDGSAGDLFTGLGVTPINIAVHQTAGLALVSNNTSTAAVQVDVMDFGTGSVLPAFITTPVQTQAATRAIAVGTDPDTAMSYGLVIVSYANGEDYAFVINLTTANFVANGTLLDLGSPQEAHIYSNTKAIVTDAGGNAHILAINTTTGAVSLSRTIALGTSPTGVAVNDTANVAYVTNQGSDTISVIDLTAGAEAVSRTITLADGPTQIIYKGGETNQTATIHDTDQSVIVLTN